MRFWAEAAVRWGGVDPSNRQALDHWWVEVFKTLPDETRQEILKFLLSKETAP